MEFQMNRTNRNRILCVVLVLVILLSGIPVTAWGEGSESLPSTGTWKKGDFKVVGYYSGDLFTDPVEDLQTDKLTHVMYAFLKPTEEGTCRPLEHPDKLKEIVEKAHNTNCQVYIAVGGWSYQNIPLVTTFEKVAASDELRGRFVSSVIDVVEEYNLDGVELDWEHPYANSAADYEKTVLDLSAALKQKGKGLSAALNGAWSTTAGPETSSYISDKCLNAFDFISVMGYDMNNEQHSPLWFANTSISYWKERGVPKEKIVLGMPLYARPSWKQYRHLVEEDPANAYKDYAATTPLESYYNGLNTLREKTLLTYRNAGGAMLFDVNEDSKGKYSVVSMIDETLNELYNMDHSGGLAATTETKASSTYVTIVVDDEKLFFYPQEGLGMPFIDEADRTIAPVRKTLEAIGVEVEYDHGKQQVIATKDDTVLIIYIGQTSITVNGVSKELDTKAVNLEGRVHIPVRAIYESFGYHITWSSTGRVVYAVS